MELFFHPYSQNSRKARIVARLLGLNVAETFVDMMKGAGHDLKFLALNPNGMVPVLRDGDFVLTESNAICQYLAGGKPNDLWPSEERKRASVARWQFWEAAHWTPALFPFFMENMIKHFTGKGEPDPAELAKGEMQLGRFGKILENQLSSSPFLVGERLTLADISVGSHLMFAGLAKIPLDPFPNIRRWFKEIEKLPAWGETQFQLP